MFEVEIKKYVKEGHKGLPCKAAQNAFDSYIEMVIHDITENNPNCTFEEVLEQLGCNLVRRTEKGRLRRRGWGLRWEKAQKGGKGTNLRGFFED